MNVVHAAIVIVGLILLAMITTPLALIIKEAVENPTLLNADIREENNEVIVLLTYNGSIKLKDVNFTATLESHGKIISESATAHVLSRNSSLTLVFGENETTGKDGITVKELVLTGKVSGLYPFQITYKPEGG